MQLIYTLKYIYSPVQNNGTEIFLSYQLTTIAGSCWWRVCWGDSVQAWLPQESCEARLHRHAGSRHKVPEEGHWINASPKSHRSHERTRGWRGCFRDWDHQSAGASTLREPGFCPGQKTLQILLERGGRAQTKTVAQTVVWAPSQSQRAFSHHTSRNCQKKPLKIIDIPQWF